jgi:hypothetical protein
MGRLNQNGYPSRMSEPEDSPAGPSAEAIDERHPLDPDPPRPPGAPDLDLDIPRPDSDGAEGKPDNEDVPDDEKVHEPPD